MKKKPFPMGFHSIQYMTEVSTLKLSKKISSKTSTTFFGRRNVGKVQLRARETETPPDEINSGERIFRLATELQQEFTHTFLCTLIKHRQDVNHRFATCLQHRVKCVAL